MDGADFALVFLAHLFSGHIIPAVRYRLHRFRFASEVSHKYGGYGDVVDMGTVLFLGGYGDGVVFVLF